jgi:hypothetical protein
LGCASKVGSTNVKTVVTDGVITCEPVIEELMKSHNADTMTKCLKYKLVEDGTITCEECMANYALTTHYLDAAEDTFTPDNTKT